MEFHLKTNKTYSNLSHKQIKASVKSLEELDWDYESLRK